MFEISLEPAKNTGLKSVFWQNSSTRVRKGALPARRSIGQEIPCQPARLPASDGLTTAEVRGARPPWAGRPSGRLRSPGGRKLPKNRNRGEKSVPFRPDFPLSAAGQTRPKIGRMEKPLVRTARLPLPHLRRSSNASKFPLDSDFLADFARFPCAACPGAEAPSPPQARSVVLAATTLRRALLLGRWRWLGLR